MGSQLLDAIKKKVNASGTEKYENAHPHTLGHLLFSHTPLKLLKKLPHPNLTISPPPLKPPSRKILQITTFSLAITSLIILGVILIRKAPPKPPRITTASTNSLYMYETGTQTYTAKIGTKSTTAPFISFEPRSGINATFAMIGSESVNAEHIGDKIVYENVRPDVDVTYSTTLNGIKEEIILHRATPSAEFVFTLNTSAHPRPIGGQHYSPFFFDDQDNYQFHFEKPFAVDSRGNRTEDIAFAIRKSLDNEDEYQLQITLNSDWLTAPNRAYPVTIDPTIVHDTSTEFAAGIINRVKDIGSGASPSLETYYQEQVSDENTVALYHFNETGDNSCAGGQDLCDSGKYGLHGTDTGGSVVSAGILANARTFDGANDRILVPDHDALSPTALTIEGWVYLTSYGTSDLIMGKAGEYWMVYNYSACTANTLGFMTYTGAWLCVSTDFQPALNTWYHVAGVYDGAFLYIYVDGSLRGGPIAQTPFSNTGNSVGIGGWDGAGTLETATKLDEIRISNTARTPEEIKASASRRPYSVFTSDIIDIGNKVANWNSLTWSEIGVGTGDGETLANSTGLVAQWNFNETSGTTADNAEGTSALDGTLSGFDSTASQDADPDSAWTVDEKRWGTGALKFDGVDSYVDVGSDASLKPTSTLSVETWVKFNTTTSGIRFLSDWHQSTTTDRWLFWIPTDNTLNWHITNLNESATRAIAAPIQRGIWYHLVGTYDGSTSKLYINGRLIGSGSLSGPMNIGTGASIRIGKQAEAGSAFSGIIDSTRFYSRALTASEILSNYNAANIELQTRVGSDTSPNDGDWEAWRPVTSETVIQSFDADQANWNIFGSLISKPLLSVRNNNPSAPTAPTGCLNNLPVVINNIGNDNTLTNYPVQLQISFQTGMASDFSDIRFTNSAGTNLDYWLETYTDSTKATAWIEINSIPANSNSTIFMWYNSCSGGNSSSGTNTFSFFDNFDTLDTNTWYVVPSSTYTVTGSVLKITLGAIGMVNPLGFNLNDGYLVESRMQTNTLTENSFGGALETSSSQFIASGNANSDSTILHMVGSAVSATHIETYFASGITSLYNTASNTRPHSIIQNDWTILGNEMTPTTTGVWRNNSPTIRFPITWTKNLNYISLGYFTGAVGNIKDTSYDWIRVRKYVANEPIANVSFSSTPINISNGSLKTLIGSNFPSSSTVAMWSFEETSGTGAFLRDLSGNGNHLTPTGSSVSQGIKGKARRFNGSSDKLTIANNSLLNNYISGGPITIEAWIRPTAFSGSWQSVLYKNTGGADCSETSCSDRQYTLWVHGNGQVYFTSTAVSNIGVGQSYITTPVGIIKLGKWFHLVGVVDSPNKQARVYINGILQGSTEYPSTGVRSATGLLSIGATGPGASFFQGDIDEVKIQNVALSSEEVMESYRLGQHQYLSRSISSTDLSGISSLPFYIAADRPGTYLSATVGESGYANYEPDANTVGLWHLDELGRDIPAYFDFDSFEGGPGSTDDWQQRNAVNPDITGTTAFSGKYSLHMPHSYGRNFENGSGEPTTVPYNTNTYPYMCMAYKIPSTTINNMLIYIDELGGWRSITMTQGESPTSYAKVASWNPLNNDNSWQHKCINLDAQLDSSLGTGTHSIRSVIWHDGGGSPAIGGEFWIDDFIISSAPYYPQGYYANDATGNNVANYPVPPSLAYGTGGTITTVNGYNIHRFTGNSTLTLSSPGIVEALVVAGGGGGGATGSGGGAGGYLYENLSLLAQAYSVTVGGGGAGGIGSSTWNGSQGGSSILSTLTAIGGGGGKTHGQSSGLDGGSGGGGPIKTAAPASTGGIGTTGQGYNGGAGYVDGGWVGNNAGGGGAGSAGAAGGNTAGTGNGGSGLYNSITGSTTAYAGGGGGGEVHGSYVGSGGLGGGGTAVVGGVGGNGTANTGGGGAGGSYPGYLNGGSGGSGIVIARYPLVQNITQSNVIGTDTVAGKIGSARYFNGLTDVIVLENESNFDFERTDSITLDAWIKTSSSVQQTIIGKQNHLSDYQGYAMRTDSAGTLNFLIQNSSSGSNSIYVNSAQTVNDGRWHHVAITYNGTSLASGVKLYIDGSIVGNVVTYDNLSASVLNSASLCIGGRNGANNLFTGSIDEPRVSNVVRTADEIRQTYESGLRTHPITIDFAASLNSGNLISSSGDTSFTIDATAYGLPQMGSRLFPGEKIIVKENVDGTEYVAQGSVISVTENTGATTITSWDAGSTFPAGGYTVNADVFKWQREYWNISEPLDSHLNATTNLTLRVTDGSEARTVWLDDLRSSADYLTNSAGSTITSSTGNRYVQYRAIFHSADESVSGNLSTVTVDYLPNNPPNTPSLDFPANTAISQPYLAVLKTTVTDPELDYVRYKIELCTNVAMTLGCQTFDQTISQTGWSGQNAETSTAYTSGTQATYTLQSPLQVGTTYYWRSSAIDPNGTNLFGNTQAVPYSFTTNDNPNIPALDTPASGSSGVALSPTLLTTGIDVDNDYLRYLIELCTNQSMTVGCNTFDQSSSQTGWSGQNTQGGTAYTSGTQASYTLQITLAQNTLYYWRSYAIDPAGSNTHSSTQTLPFTFTTNKSPNIPALNSPTNGATGVSITPTLLLTGTDDNDDYLRYRIQICTNEVMTLNCQTFDQTASQTGWSAQDTEGGTAYISGTQAQYTLQSPLLTNIIYYWKSTAIDPSGTNIFSATQTTPNSFTTLAAPAQASTCTVEKDRDNTRITIRWTDNSQTENGYQVWKVTDGGAPVRITPDFSANTTSYTDLEITSGHTYGYLIRSFQYDGGNTIYSNWCPTPTSNLSSGGFTIF